MNIYVVTDGEYSAYRICCVCSTKEKAEGAALLYATDNPVEEWELDALPEHPVGMVLYLVAMDAHGTAEQVRRLSCEDSDEPEWEPYGNGRTVAFVMWAENEQHAVKIANERRVQLIASGEWTTDFKVWHERKMKARAIEQDAP